MTAPTLSPIPALPAASPATSAATLDDVARAVGVSAATVSRAINRPLTVRAEVRSKVLLAVERLSYVPHAGARAMSLRRSGTVGVVLPTIDNAIFARGLQAFQRRVVASGRHVLLAISDYDAAQESAQVNNLIERGVDAVALTGISQRPELIAKLAQRGLPWVHSGSFPAPTGSACVGFRNRAAIAKAVRYLLDLGHQRFAMLAGVMADNDRAMERVQGVRETLRRARLALPARALAQSAYDLQSARVATRQLLSASPAPTALLCGNDVLAYGALLEAQALGIQVPRQLSVIGFDDLDLSRHWQPGLTTIHVPTELMWTLAAEHLIARLDGTARAATQTELAVELVVRGSTAAPTRRDLVTARSSVSLRVR